MAGDATHGLSVVVRAMRPWLARGLLWSGLLLCAYAVWKMRGQVDAWNGQVSVLDGVVAAILLYSSWVFSVAAWRQFVRAYTQVLPTWRSAFRQSALIFVGKYVPGGVFGFMVRLYDEAAPRTGRGRLLAAGLAEQAVGFAMVVCFGGLLYAAALHRQFALVLLALLLPILALASIQSLRWLVSNVPWLGRLRAGADLSAPGRSRLFTASVFSLVQQCLGALLVGLLAARLCNLDLVGAMGVAGAFGLAVGAGMLVIIAPGGIGIREGAIVALVAPWLGTAEAFFLAAVLRIVTAAMDFSVGAIAILLRR